jgi:CheY-like chemotaxis protein
MESIRVLHVDDNPEFGDMVARFLERENHRFDIETTTEARDAVDYLTEHPVDCVVSDYEMPDHLPRRSRRGLSVDSRSIH